jgi:hypothetical protein
LVVRPPSVGRFEGAVDGGPVHGTVAVVATSCPRALQQHRDVVIVLGVERQWRDGRTGLTATGMTDPAGLTSRRGPA